MSTTLTTARQAAERLAREIQDRDLPGLMPTEIREHTRIQQLIEQARETILDPRAPDQLVCGCAADLVKLLTSFDRDEILFERPASPQPVRILLRKFLIRIPLRAAERELGQVREVME